MAVVQPRHFQARHPSTGMNNRNYIDRPGADPGPSLTVRRMDPTPKRVRANHIYHRWTVFTRKAISFISGGGLSSVSISPIVIISAVQHCLFRFLGKTALLICLVFVGYDFFWWPFKIHGNIW
ncbi:unnamed protein product [Ectocarpus fasciculatus]